MLFPPKNNYPKSVLWTALQLLNYWAPEQIPRLPAPIDVPRSFSDADYTTSGCLSNDVIVHQNWHVLVASRRPSPALCRAVRLRSGNFSDYFLDVRVYNEVLPRRNRPVGAGLIFNADDAENAEFILFQYGVAFTFVWE